MEIKVKDITTNRKAERNEITVTNLTPEGILFRGGKWLEWSLSIKEGTGWDDDYTENHKAGFFTATHETLGSIEGNEDGVFTICPTNSLTELVNSFNENVELTREKITIEL